ncbi:MAG: carbohydrate ABC transporter permease [Christensenellales bacterium]|nr:carbohydrate ABC transporter permease [Christensenellales bacterium]
MNKKQASRGSARAHRGVSSVIFTIFLWLYAAISLYPLLWMIFYSFKGNEEIFVTNPFGPPITWKFSNYVNAWTQYDVPMYFKNSVVVGIVSVSLTVICAMLFTFATARLQWKLKGTVRTFIALGMFIPVQAIMLPVVQTVDALGLMGTRWSLIFPYAAINLAFACMVYYGFFKGIPKEMEEAACIDGANIWQTFFHIIAPLVAPATITIAIYVFLAAWNEFILANVLVGSFAKLKTLPLGVLFFQGQFTTDWGSMGATMVIASLPAILVYTLFSERVEQAMTVSGAVKG